MNNVFTRIIGAIAGLAIMAGACAAWHYWHVDGFISFIFVASGCYLVWYSFE